MQHASGQTYTPLSIYTLCSIQFYVTYLTKGSPLLLLGHKIVDLLIEITHAVQDESSRVDDSSTGRIKTTKGQERIDLK